MIFSRHCWFFLWGALTLIGAGRGYPGTILSIGHRGDSLRAPENTVAAFVACSNKADLVEWDVRVSADGTLVIMHDATVNRTTDGSGNVAALTLAQLKALDAGSKFSPSFAGERIPTLEEAITSTVPFATPLIEHKAGSAAAYLAELQRLGAITNVVVQSFDWNFLAALHALEPAIPLCALGNSILTPALLTNAMNAGARTVAWEQSRISAAEVSLVHDLGLKLFVWTVDGPAIKTFIDLGVDGIISNDPGMVRNFQQPATNGPVNFPAGLIAYWRMDDGLTNAMAVPVTDSKGTNTATLARGDGLSHWAGVETAMFGGCLQLDGLNASVLIPRTDSLDIGTNGLTLSLWVRLTRLPSQLGASYGAIFDSTNDAYVVYLDRGSKELRFKVTDVNNHAARPGIPETALQTNQWLHVVATYSGQASPIGGEAWIYLNGEAKDAHYGSDSNPPLGLTGNVKPGQFAAMGREGHTGASYFSGLVDDVAIWNRALNATEVATLHQAGQAGLSLGDLLRQPTALIQYRSIQLAEGNQVAITFQNMGTWKSFRLLRAASLSGPFLPIYELAPTNLSRGVYRFDCPRDAAPACYFRVEAY